MALQTLAKMPIACAVVYLVYTTNTGRYSRMLTSKTRVAPLKELSIPRLELLACLILVKLMNTVKNALISQVSIQKWNLWSDSMTALYWIRNKGEWKQFVPHRVNEIFKLSNKNDWRHCPSEQNPADIGSRGLLAIDLKSDELWWEGPKWLIEPEKQCPANNSIAPTTEGREEEEKKTAVMTVSSVTPYGVEKVIEIRNYSALQKLYKVTAWVQHFCFNISKRRNDRKFGPLSLEEIVAAEREWIKAAQRELRQGANYQQLISKFGLTEDNEGMLRCKGRLEYSDLPPETREPIILPKEHQLTLLQIQQCHIRVLHSGVRCMLTELRSRFWVPKWGQVVKHVLNRCTICKKLEGRPFAHPPTASLPDFRVTASPPFYRTGVDFAGPLFVKGKSGPMKKVYSALFTCCVTRAIHVDLVDLSVETFKTCLKRLGK